MCRTTPELELLASQLKHPGELFVYHPITPSASELDALDNRVRDTMAVVTEYLANPTGVVEYEIDDPDGLRHQWLLFKTFETVVGEPLSQGRMRQR